MKVENGLDYFNNLHKGKGKEAKEKAVKDKATARKKEADEAKARTGTVYEPSGSVLKKD